MNVPTPIPVFKHINSLIFLSNTFLKAMRQKDICLKYNFPQKFLTAMSTRSHFSVLSPIFGIVDTFKLIQLQHPI